MRYVKLICIMLLWKQFALVDGNRKGGAEAQLHMGSERTEEESDRDAYNGGIHFVRGGVMHVGTSGAT